LTPHNFFRGGAPKILKPASGTPFQGLLPGKVWTMPPDPKGWEKILPQNFGERKKKEERNFSSKTEYLRPLLCVGGGITRMGFFMD